MLVSYPDTSVGRVTECYHLFKRYEHALPEVAIAATGDHWMHLIVTRSNAPQAVGDCIDTDACDGRLQLYETHTTILDS